VVIEDDVEIGAQSAIARGAVGDTVIAKGTKLDSLVTIGHGTRIGEHSLLVAQVGVAGSVTVGHHFVAAGQAGIVGHINIGDRVTVGAQTGVTGDLKTGAVVANTPAMPLGLAKRVVVLWGRLPSLFDRVKRLEKRAGIEPAETGAEDASA
jgi:UDP-3-O-[3-hydroxymyristoyl] glucosamine N-acyltransferase